MKTEKFKIKKFSFNVISPDNVENAGPACVWAQPLYRANVTAIGYGNTKFGELINIKKI